MAHTVWCCCHRRAITYDTDPHRLRRHFSEMSRTWSYECLHCNTVWLTWQSGWEEDTDYTWEGS